MSSFVERGYSALRRGIDAPIQILLWATEVSALHTDVNVFWLQRDEISFGHGSSERRRPTNCLRQYLGDSSISDSYIVVDS